MISAKEIVCSSKLVEEPLIELNKKIDLITNNIVLVKGGRGTGKTTLLLNREINNKLKGITSIYTKFNAEDNDMYIASPFKEHYYELEMSRVLLRHIKEEGKLTKIVQLIDRERMAYYAELTAYVNDMLGKKKITKKGLLSFGDFTEELVHEIRKSEGCSSLELMIERFDSIEGSSKHAQEYIKNYFELFDKSILVVDDVNAKTALDVVKLDYTEDIYVVSAIMSRYITESSLKNKLEWLDFFSNQRVSELISLCHGDLKMLLEAFDYINKYFVIDELNTRLLMNEFRKRIEDLNINKDKVKTLTIKPTLYI